jgi:hypothetical protein
MATAGPAPAEADDTDKRADTARPYPTGPNLVEASVAVPEPSPTRWAVPNTLAAVLTARAASAVVVKRRLLMLMGLRGRQRGRRDLDEHAGVLGHQQTTTAWQRAALHLAADEALIGVGVHHQ